jgi:hypothetical protein
MQNRKLHNLILPVIFVLALLLTACEGPEPEMPAQTWKGIRIQVETRPPQMGIGMNEFLVVASRGTGRGIPAHDLIVSLAINDTGHWEQAIQDGFVGVYRRAMRVSDPSSDILLVRIERGDDSGILRFPLNEQRVPAQ